MFSIDRLNVYGILFLFNLLYILLSRNVRNYLDSNRWVNLVQYRGTFRVFNNRKFTKKLQYLEISKLKFIHTCLIADHLSLHSHSMVSFFMLLIIFFLLKPKMPKGFTFSAFVMFYVICLYLLLSVK